MWLRMRCQRSTAAGLIETKRNGSTSADEITLLGWHIGIRVQRAERFVAFSTMHTIARIDIMSGGFHKCLKRFSNRILLCPWLTMPVNQKLKLQICYVTRDIFDRANCTSQNQVKLKNIIQIDIKKYYVIYYKRCANKVQEK